MPKLMHLWDFGSPLPIASLQMELSDSSRCHAKPWSALSMLWDGQGVLPESLCMHMSQQAMDYGCIGARRSTAVSLSYLLHAG